MNSYNYTPPVPKLPPFATYIPDRNPQFKVHSNRGLAQNAVMLQFSYKKARGGVVFIYSLMDNRWLEVADVPPGATGKFSEYLIYTGQDI